MKQTKAERSVVAAWMGYLQREPTWPRLICKSWKVFLFRIVAITAITWLLAESRFRATAFFAVGMLVGSLIRDLEWLRKTAKLWPVVKNYLNWEKISADHTEQAQQKEKKEVEPAA